MHSGKTHVLIAGGGVAALEAAIALHEIAPESVAVELLSPDEYFSFRPLAVTLPFEGTELRFDLGELAREVGASLTRGALTGLDAWRHRAYTSTNHEIEYDVLLIACGALSLRAVKGAITFRGATDSGLVEVVLDELTRGVIRSVAFVVPWGHTWPLPAYELALLASSPRVAGTELWVVTPEQEPLQLFGPPAGEAVRELFATQGLRLRTDAFAGVFADGQLELAPDPPLAVDRAIALPRLAGAPIDGIPQTIEGFIPVDDHGRVHGLADVYAAGDITNFPVKHGGLAAQQALAAAEMIAANAGATVDPQPFRPVVHGLLLTGSVPRFLRREIHGTAEHEPVIATEPLWWPPAKIAGRHLGALLARLADTPEQKMESHVDALDISVPLDADVLERLDTEPALMTDDTADDEVEYGLVSSMRLCEAAPEDTLGEIAERMLHEDVSAVVICEYGRLIGILTTHDLLAASAARAHPSEARARQWMTADPITVDSGSTRSASARKMHVYGIRHLPVVVEERPVGMYHLDEDVAVATRVPLGLGF